MNGKNAWFLITSEEIEQNRKGLQDVGHEPPGNQYRLYDCTGHKGQTGA